MLVAEVTHAESHAVTAATVPVDAPTQLTAPPKTILLYSTQPEFFERKDTCFNRRGVEVFGAARPQDLRAVVQARKVDLVISRGIPQHCTLADVRTMVPHGVPLVIMTTENDDAAILASFERAPDVTVIRPPYGESLMDTTARLLTISLRRYLRILVQIAVGDKEKGGFGFTHNLSASGMLLESRRRLEIGEELAMSFLIPGASRMAHVVGRVVREAPSPETTSFRFGLQFVTISQEDKDMILRLTSPEN